MSLELPLVIVQIDVCSALMLILLLKSRPLLLEIYMLTRQLLFLNFEKFRLLLIILVFILLLLLSALKPQLQASDLIFDIQVISLFLAGIKNLSFEVFKLRVRS